MEKIQKQIKTLDIKLLAIVFAIVVTLCLIFIWIDKYLLLFVIGVAFIIISFSFFNFKPLWYLGIFCMPLSLELSQFLGDAALTVPSDLIVAGFSILFLMKIPKYKEDLQKIFSHPITVSILLYFLWMIITSLFAEKPIVAIKFTLNTYWYTSAYFLWTILFLKDNKKDFYNWLYIIAIPICFVVIYTMYKHSFKGFSKQASYYIMAPFYKEHTAYAASIAVLVPIYFILSIYSNLKKWVKVSFFFVFLILFLGVITSFTRGAWLGVLFAVFTFWALKYWGFTRVIIPFSLPFLAGFLIFFSADVFFTFSNTGNSVDQGLNKHIKSIINLRTDESNKERINRWVAAKSMLEERPMTGFGPGNYAMTYAPYQQYEFMTSISTFKGDGGTAHSEFFLAASEMGYLGLLLVIIWFLTTIIKGFQGVLKSKSRENLYLYMAALTGLMTFFIHAFFNNFLDQDKVAIPVYFCMAIIVSLDTFYSHDN